MIIITNNKIKRFHIKVLIFIIKLFIKNKKCTFKIIMYIIIYDNSIFLYIKSFFGLTKKN